MRTLICIIFLLTTTFSYADDVFVIVMQKQQEKKQKGWSLLGWMETRKQVALMDQWLALNSTPSAPEFYLNLNTSQYKYNHNKYTLYHGAAGAFFSIFGIEAEYERSNEKYTKLATQFSMRILGSSNQYTNLTLHYGYRDLKESYNQYIGGNLTFNLFSFIGFQGTYNRYFKGLGNGDLYQIGPFIDILFVRLYAHWFKETINDNESTGTRIGLKVYF